MEEPPLWPARRMRAAPSAAGPARRRGGAGVARRRRASLAPKSWPVCERRSAGSTPVPAKVTSYVAACDSAGPARWRRHSRARRPRGGATETSSTAAGHAGLRPKTGAPPACPAACGAALAGPVAKPTSSESRPVSVARPGSPRSSRSIFTRTPPSRPFPAPPRRAGNRRAGRGPRRPRRRRGRRRTRCRCRLPRPPRRAARTGPRGKRAARC